MDRPVIAGGAKAKPTPWATSQRYGDAELTLLKEALDQNTLFYAQGALVKRLEETFATMNGSRHAVACTSGTAAIHTALMALGLSPGDEVIVPPITDMGTLVPILFQGAVPVFADLDPHTYALDPAAVEAAVTSKTRAVIAVHLWGNACDLDLLETICRRHGLALVEDCAQAFGATYRRRPVGTTGAFGCFSFNEFKHLSCGDGGLVLTDDPALASRARLATDKCYNREADATQRNPIFLANNYRMTELQGAVALAQTARLNDIIAKRRRWCERLHQGLAGIEGLSRPMPTPGCDPSWWFYMMRVDSTALGADADAFAGAVNAEGIPVGAHYIGRCVYEYPIFVDHSAFARGRHAYEAYHYGAGLCPVAESILRDCVILGIKEWYSDADLDETVAGIRKVAQWFAANRT